MANLTQVLAVGIRSQNDSGTEAVEAANNFLNGKVNDFLSAMLDPPVGHSEQNCHNMMKMWFHGGYEELILFEFWRIDSLCELLFSCLIIFVMSALYEGIKWFRVYLQIASDRADLECRRASRIETTSSFLGERNEDALVYKPTAAVNSENASRVCYHGFKSPFAFRHVIQGVLYAVQLTLAYWMMLIAMTYNIYLTAAVILGAAFGHWLFAVLKCLNPHVDHLNSLATDACH